MKPILFLLMLKPGFYYFVGVGIGSRRPRRGQLSELFVSLAIKNTKQNNLPVSAEQGKEEFFYIFFGLPTLHAVQTSRENGTE